MKYEYYITNYLCQNISLVKIMLTMNIGKNGSNPGNIWKKGVQGFTQIAQTSLHFWLFNQTISNYRFKPCPTSMEQFSFHASDFRLFQKPWKVWTPPILKMILAAKQVKPFKVFEMFHCLSMYECHVFLPPPVTVLHRRAIPQYCILVRRVEQGNGFQL